MGKDEKDYLLTIKTTYKNYSRWLKVYLKKNEEEIRIVDCKEISGNKGDISAKIEKINGENTKDESYYLLEVGKNNIYFIEENGDIKPFMKSCPEEFMRLREPNLKKMDKKTIEEILKNKNKD